MTNLIFLQNTVNSDRWEYITGFFILCFHHKVINCLVRKKKHQTGIKEMDIAKQFYRGLKTSLLWLISFGAITEELNLF